MNFQIHSLPAGDFAPLFELTDAELAERNAVRMVVNAKPGTPCRVSLQDAEVGETVILLNYAHFPHASPYKATHAIFVRKDARQAEPAVNEVPLVLTARLISVRIFDENHMMIGADVVPGETLAQTLSTAFEDTEVSYIHLHNAKPGCFAASVRRAA